MSSRKGINNKKTEAPFLVDPMLLKNPTFKTTHTSHYTTSPRNRYSNVESKIKTNTTK